MEDKIKRQQELIDKLVNIIYELTKNSRDWREEEKQDLITELKNYFSFLHDLKSNNIINEETHDILIHKFGTITQKVQIMLDLPIK